VCGAVDDGKSTLIGRLLVETGSVPLDELALSKNSDGSYDLSRLTDGLQAEREQGITIDVAYRYLKLPEGNRALLADSPGHEQYTRNMAVAASTADLAIIAVDSSKGVSTQTKRHASICQLMGVRAVVVALNKIDILDKKEQKKLISELTQEIESEFTTLFKNLSSNKADHPRVVVVPVSGGRGDNITSAKSDDVSLLSTIIDELEGIESKLSIPSPELRIPIQSVLKQDGKRWYVGRIASGSIHLGDEVLLWPSMNRCRVTELTVSGTAVNGAGAGTSVSLSMENDVVLGRGDVVVGINNNFEQCLSRAHLANLVWISSEPLGISTSYLLRVGPIEIPVRVEVVRYQIDPETNLQVKSGGLGNNQIARVEISADRPFLLDAYSVSRDTGGFILCDRVTGDTVAAGMSISPLQRLSEVTRYLFEVTRELRERQNGIRGGVMWFTGLPGSGKSTIANQLEKTLFEVGIRSFVIDGDMVRQTLSSDLGFSIEDRTENVRRVAQLSSLMLEAGMVVLVCLVSPSASDRASARSLFSNSDFVEVHVDTPLEVCKLRDPKGLYARASNDPSNEMTGVGQQYEAPENPHFVLDGTRDILENCKPLLDWVRSRQI
jgi:bifunctional enzyme CysN/CysC